MGDDAAVDEGALWVHWRGTLVLDTASGSWVPADDLDAVAHAAGHKAVLEERRTAVAREAARAAKVESVYRVWHRERHRHEESLDEVKNTGRVDIDGKAGKEERGGESSAELPGDGADEVSLAKTIGTGSRAVGAIPTALLHCSRVLIIDGGRHGRKVGFSRDGDRKGTGRTQLERCRW
jgi:hypothetical protein